MYIHLVGVMTYDALLELSNVRVDKDNDTSRLKVRYCKRCNEMLSPNHEFCIRCGYSDKDAMVEGSVSNDLVYRINRLESILARLASKLYVDNNDNNNIDSKRRKKGNSIDR